MNDQEVTTYQPLEAQSTALKAAGIAIALVRRVPTPLKSLADQIVRSASSVPANLSEGHGRFGKDRQYHYSVAYGSAKEVDVHLRILLQPGVLDESRTETLLDLFDSVRAMTWRLIQEVIGTQRQRQIQVSDTESVTPKQLRILRMQKSPGHGPDFVEQSCCHFGSGGINDSNTTKQSKESVSLFRRAISYSPVIEAVSTNSPLALTQVCSRGTRCPDRLICERFEWRGYPFHHRQCDSSCF